MRYVIASRRAGKFSDAQKLASRSAMSFAMNSFEDDVFHANDPPDKLARRVAIVDTEPDKLIAMNFGPDVIVEPEIRYWPEVMPPLDLPRASPRPVQAAAAAVGNGVAIVCTGAGQPLQNAAFKLYARNLVGVTEFPGVTDATGTCNPTLPPGYEAAAVLVDPPGEFWSMLTRGARVLDPVDCPTLPMDGPLGWWHGSVGVRGFSSDSGKGIKVGIIDMGAGPHACLGHVVLVGAFTNGKVLPAAAADVGMHGTHVAGTIGARPADRHEYGGIAPGCDIFVARVFASAESGASNADIANAIDELSKNQGVDLINMSLGSETPSEVVGDAITDAAERGTLCIRAAGNTGRGVNYPGAHPEAVAVAALGLAGWPPPGSLSDTRLPSDHALFGHRNLYAANFTSHGPQVFCAAPGVGIIAAVPDRFGDATLFAAMDGSSMASPVACGTLAALLGADAGYRRLPRDRTRTATAKKIPRSCLQDLGLDATYQGRRIPYIMPPTV